MKKSKIGIDLDSVLAEMGPALNNYHNRKWGTNLSEADYIHYGLSKIWNCSPDEVVDRVYEFYETSDFDNIEPVKGSQAGINYLSERYELLLITSRPGFLEEKTHQWLDNYFSGQFDEVIHTGQFSKNTKAPPKSQIAKQKNIIAMVEDSYEYATDLVKNGIFVYLRDMSWNRSFDDLPNMKRFYDWKEIEYYL